MSRPAWVGLHESLHLIWLIGVLVSACNLDCWCWTSGGHCRASAHRQYLQAGAPAATALLQSRVQDALQPVCFAVAGGVPAGSRGGRIHTRSCQRIRFDSFTDWARALCVQRGHLASLLKLSLQNRAMVGSMMFSLALSAITNQASWQFIGVECAAEIHQCRGGLAELPVWNQSCCKCANQTHHMSKGRDGSHSCSRCGLQSVQDGVWRRAKLASKKAFPEARRKSTPIWWSNSSVGGN